MKKFISKKAFTLVEIMLAVGIFAIAIVAMIGLFGAAVSSVEEVDSYDQMVLASSRMEDMVESVPFEVIYDLALNGAQDENALFFYNVFDGDQIFPEGPFDISANGEFNTSERLRKSDVTSAINRGDVADNVVIVVEIPPIQNNAGNRPIEMNVDFPPDPDLYEEAYVPFWVNIYAVPLINFTEGATDITEEDNELISFPMAKVR